MALRRGPPRVAAPHPYGGSGATGGRVQSPVGVSSAAEPAGGARRPSAAKGGLRREGAPVRVRCGSGAAHVPGGDARRVGRRQSRGPSHGQGSGLHGFWVPWRAETQSQEDRAYTGARRSPRVSRATSGSPARRPAPGRRSPSQRPWGVCAEQRRPAPAAAPGASRRSLGLVLSRSGSGNAALPPGCAGPTAPLRPRPT
jgi:hypothetical protein